MTKIVSSTEYFTRGGTPEHIVDFLSGDRAANSFMLGNLKSMGFEPSKHQEILICVDEDWDGNPGNSMGIIGVLMAHFTNALLYFPPSWPSGSKNRSGSTALPLYNVLVQWLHSGRVNRINGLSRCMDEVEKHISSAAPEVLIHRRGMRLAVYDPEQNGDPLQSTDTSGADLPVENPPPDGLHLEKAVGPDWRLLDSIMDEKEHIDEFVVAAGARETFRNSHEAGGARSFALKDSSGRVLAAASSTAENQRTAMIVGVFTVKDCRSRGYSRYLMGILLGELIAEGLIPVLFYDNPLAEKIYKGMGFLDAEGYDLLHFTFR